MNGINKDPEYTVPPTPTDKNIIMYQLKAFKKSSGTTHTLPILGVSFDLNDGEVILKMHWSILSYILCLYSYHLIACFHYKCSV